MKRRKKTKAHRISCVLNPLRDEMQNKLEIFYAVCWYRSLTRSRARTHTHTLSRTHVSLCVCKCGHCHCASCYFLFSIHSNCLSLDLHIFLFSFRISLPFFLFVFIVYNNNNTPHHHHHHFQRTAFSAAFRFETKKRYSLSLAHSVHCANGFIVVVRLFVCTVSVAPL